MQYPYTHDGSRKEAPYDGDHAMRDWQCMPYVSSHEYYNHSEQNSYTLPFRLCPSHGGRHTTSNNCYSMPCMRVHSKSEPQLDYAHSFSRNSDTLRHASLELSGALFQEPPHTMSPLSSEPISGFMGYSHSTIDGTQGYRTSPDTLMFSAFDPTCQQTALLTEQSRGRLVQADFHHLPFELTQVAARSASAFSADHDTAFSAPRQIPQAPYSDGEETHPAVIVYIPAQLAVNAKLSRDLAETYGWLKPAFSDPLHQWKQKKWTVRLKFEEYAVNLRPQQFYAWSAGRKLPVYAEWTQRDLLRRSPWSRRQPLSRLELAWRVAEELKRYMQALERQGTPLMWGAHKVCFEHIVIEEIKFCGKGSVQPTLAIHPDFAVLYHQG
ncbi:hypothetical protein PYCCODRAFT_664934 [Trametes coccinea BRFM310]|uniref:Uncharacterized protein n=1 Tax=Trametes coccinea (strain BRFM310) TaxID=1353009 RepID=A0A1Y2II19_TRAC3|nr:hypothetical protein PYCCODRAFT_664934 [Trametes coccinea BRFM310]